MFMLVSVTGLDFDENDSSRLSVSCCCAVFATALVYCSAADSDCWSRCTAVSFCVFIRVVLLLVHAKCGA